MGLVKLARMNKEALVAEAFHAAMPMFNNFGTMAGIVKGTVQPAMGMLRNWGVAKSGVNLSKNLIPRVINKQVAPAVNKSFHLFDTFANKIPKPLKTVGSTFTNLAAAMPGGL